MDGIGLWRWLKCRLFAMRGAMVPRADVLTDVAAKQPIADAAAEVVRDFATQLDGQIADAARGIEHVRLREGLGGAGIQASATRSAVFRRKGLVVGQPLIGQKCCEKKVAP